MKLGLVAMVMAVAVSNTAWADNCTEAKRNDLAKIGYAQQAVDKICAAAASVSFTLDSPNLAHFYPNAQDPAMPAYYGTKVGFPQTVQQSIEKFTQASLDRDALQVSATVVVTATAATITLSGDDSAALDKAKGYAAMLPAFMSAGKAGLGWQGALNCQNAATGAKCWDPTPGKSPWAFYLPLGLPLVNQKAVMLLNYPPSDALCSGDYLSNFTMARWKTVLQRVGIVDPLLYENIVDVHPIAAPGSGQSGSIAQTTSYFLSQTPPNYDQDMLDLMLVTKATAKGGAATIPLQVAGSDALSAWATMTGQSSVKPGSVGTYSRAGGASTPWVATNHPDVTTYQMCKGDPSDDSVAVAAGHTTSTATATYVDDQLVEDELMDLRAACTLKTLAEKPGMDPQVAMAECEAVWCTDDNGKCRKKDVCIQARLDYDFTSAGQCKCEQAAEAFCSANSNNACPSTTSLTSCADYNAKYCAGTPHQSYNTCTSLTPSALPN